MRFSKLSGAGSLIVAVLTAVLMLPSVPAGAGQMPAAGGSDRASGAPTLDDAMHHFYSGRFESSAALALAVRETQPDNLHTYDVRTSALHFQLRRTMGEGEDRDRAYTECAPCAGLVETFLEDFRRGRAAARERLATHPDDLDALFYLGRLDLNYVWLKLGTLGQRTGWNEYWEARRSLDAVLKANPAHTRARIARAWIDYIVDTKMTRGFRWILGGGNRKRALATIREIAAGGAAKYEHAEAVFGLWDMEQRERDIPAAVVAARQLVREFPDNQELARFLAKNGG